jgi:hypothetical protein
MTQKDANSVTAADFTKVADMIDRGDFNNDVDPKHITFNTPDRAELVRMLRFAAEHVDPCVPRERLVALRDAIDEVLADVTTEAAGPK